MLIQVQLIALTGNNVSGQTTLDTALPALQLLYPMGGEEWYSGQTLDILWSAEDPNLEGNGIALYYSVVGDSNYIGIVSEITNTGVWEWTIPELQCDAGYIKVRAEDSFGNVAWVHNALPFSIYNLIPANPDSVTVQISDNLHAIIAWNAVTHSTPPHNIPITPDGYLVFYAETPSDNDQNYYLLGSTEDTSYTHHKALDFQDKLFYRVICYKNMSTRDTHYLHTILQGDHRISLAELQKEWGGR